MFEILVTDPGPGHRLGADHRAAFRAGIKNARRQGAQAILITVEGDAWAQDASETEEASTARSVSSEFHQLLLDLFGLDVPVIVYLDGKVFGLGLSLALAGDVRFATKNVTLAIGNPDSANALTAGAAWLVSERVGSALGGHLAWTGGALTAVEAGQLRIVSHVVDDDAPARQLAATLASLPPGTSSTLKRSTNSRLRGAFAEQLDYDAWLAQAAAKGRTHG